MAKGVDIGRDSELGTSISAITIPQEFYILGHFFLETMKETREDEPHSSLQDHELPLVSSALKQPLEGAQSIAIQPAPETDLAV